MSSYIKLISLSIVIISLFTACGNDNNVETHSTKNAKINLNPTGPGGPIDNPGGFNINTPNNGCTKGSGQKLGCVRFASGQSGTIIFAINGNSAGKTCAQNAARVITKIQLTATDANPGSQPSSKGDFAAGSYPMLPMFKTDGFPELDITTGVVWAADADNPAISRIVVQNLNTSSNPDPAGVDFWYQVTVKNCSSDRYWVSDPRGENEGMN